MPRLRVLVLGVLSLGAGVGIARLASSVVASWPSRRNALELQSIRVLADSQGEAGRFPRIAITLRNPAPSLSFLTTLDLEASTRLRRAQTGNCSAPEASKRAARKYHLFIDGQRTIAHDTVLLSQLVDPESLHRFVIAVGQSGPRSHAEYDVTLTLRYNEHSVLPLGRLTLTIDSPPCKT